MALPEYAPRLMIAGGLICMVYGLSMDTSVQSGAGRVVNIGLLAQQGSVLFVGGIVLIGGILIYGFSERHKTPEQTAREEAELGMQKRDEAMNAELERANFGVDEMIRRVCAYIRNKGWR